MRLRRMILAAAAILLAPQASAQPAPAPAPAAAGPVDARALVAEMRKVLAENYVLPEVRPKLDAVLAKGLAEGRYAVADPAAMVERINADLEAVAHDKHLGLMYDPRGAARLTAEGRGRGDDDAPPTPSDIRLATQRNHGFTEMKLLPGNIRYLNLEGFVWAGPASAAAYDVAMRFARDGGAVIIDLRGNGGGSPEAVQYLVSHFMEPDRPLVTFHMGASQVDRLSTLPTLPAGRMVGKPLYVLTSGRTASAAEEFAGHVAGFRLGELIGETTAGAGFRNSFFVLRGGYLISVSVGRAVLAATGKDWEGVGIAPTQKVAPDKALQIAQVQALRRLAAAAPEGDRARLEANAALLAAQVDPVATALPLAAYAGSFGERTVAVEEGRLTYRRTGGAKLRLVAIGPNLFTFENDASTRVAYKVAGTSTTGFELIRGDGSRETVGRTN